MRKLIAIMGIVAFAGAAQADGPFNWTGLYIGAHAGYGWGEWDGNLLYEEGGHGTGAFDAYDLWGDTTERSLSGGSALGGIQLGFNVQSGSFVWGIEGDVSWMNLEDEGSFRTFQANGAPGDVVWNIRNKLVMLGTLRGRVGLANGGTMAYLTGGLAWAQTSSELVVNQPFPANNDVTATGSADKSHFGWVAGGGLEWAITRSLSIKGEYLYMDLGSADYNLTGTNFITNPDSVHDTDSFPADLTVQTVRVGVNYRFGAD